MFDTAALDAVLQLSVALAIGLLVGLERGWKSRELGEGRRIAGFRTFGLTGLLGGVAGLLSLDQGPLPIGLIFLALSLLLAVVYARTTSADPAANISITTLIALLLTFALGALATYLDIALAAAAAVVATLLLDLKSTLHGWLNRLEERELTALLRLLLISVVVLPFLPDEQFGPWQALNPHELWWMVVLISGISFYGYVMVKLLGQRRGLALTALFAGLTSSTALTLHFSRLARRQPEQALLLGSGILFSCSAMLPRMLLMILVLNAALVPPLLLPFAAMEAVTLLPALYGWMRADRVGTFELAPLSNPVELKAAFGFGLLLTLVVILCAAARQLIGDEALLPVALISGIADVDAITMLLSRLSLTEVSPTTALAGIIAVAVSNSLAKAALAMLIGGKRTGWRVALPLIGSAGVGLSFWLLWL